MRRPKSLLSVLAALMVVQVVAQVGRAVELPLRLSAEASQPDLLQGCSDIPEVVALVKELRIRESRIQKYMEAIDRRESDLKTATATLSQHLAKLRTANSARRPGSAPPEAVADDVARLIAVYDQMAPKDAAAVLSALPPAFASEILMRVSPETGARIMAAVEPGQAAILTTHMGARSARKH